MLNSVKVSAYTFYRMIATQIHSPTLTIWIEVCGKLIERKWFVQFHIHMHAFVCVCIKNKI